MACYPVIGAHAVFLSKQALKLSAPAVDNQRNVGTESAMSQTTNLQLTDREFERLRGLVRRHTAIELSDGKRQLAYSRFVRRVRELGLASFDAYCDLIDDGDTNEIAEFTSAITTNFTRFFREDHHFEFLAGLVTGYSGPRQLRIWSAGCATGEEPYSSAICLLETIPDIDSWDIKILATDLDTEALRVAANGTYPGDRVYDLDPQLLKRWFLRGKGRFNKQVRVAPPVQKYVHFRKLNLIGDWPMQGPFDVIFCRNVVIYFSPESKKTLIERFAELQHPGSHLVAGHSENLAPITDRYARVGRTIYERC